MSKAAAAMVGRTCLVTGATSGIGRTAATALARLGAEAGLVARDPARGQAAYNQSKLANVLFIYELARRLEGAGVTVNCAATTRAGGPGGPPGGPTIPSWRGGCGGSAGS